MIIKKGTLLLGRQFVRTDIRFEHTIQELCLACEESCAKEEIYDAHDGFVLPGFVELHSHGAKGADFSDGMFEGVERIAAYYLSQGITSFLATTTTISLSELEQACASVRLFREKNRADLPQCRGIHLEGPFINSLKKGAEP